MKAIFGLVPDNALWAVDDLGGDFFATVRRQAVHEEGFRGRLSHHVLINAPISEGLAAFFVFCLVAHARPDIGRDQVSAFACFMRVDELFDHSGFNGCQAGRVKYIALWGRHMQREAQKLGGLNPGVGHVVGVTNPRYDFAGQAAARLDVRKDIGQDLAGMELVRQPMLFLLTYWCLTPLRYHQQFLIFQYY